jgi:signal peptidase I
MVSGRSEVFCFTGVAGYHTPVSAGPPNPYAPGVALAQDEARAAEQRPKRWLAIVAALLCFQYATGAGLYVLGRRQRFVAWLVAGLVASGLLIAGVRMASFGLFLVAFLGVIAIALGALIDSIASAPVLPAPRTGRAIIVVLLVFAGGRGLGLAAKRWLAEAFYIPSAAMLPTLAVGDQIMVKKGTAGIKRGDLIAFRYPLDPSTSYVKRVIAVAGDVVTVRYDVVTVNGRELPQAPFGGCPPPNEWKGCKLVSETNGRSTYTIMLEGTSHDAEARVVPPGKFFVLGDNRSNSSDSRVWGFVPVENVLGTAVFVYYTTTGTNRIGNLL